MSIIYLTICWRFILSCFSCDWKLDRYRYPNAPQSMSIEFFKSTFSSFGVVNFIKIYLVSIFGPRYDLVHFLQKSYIGMFF